MADEGGGGGLLEFVFGFFDKAKEKEDEKKDEAPASRQRDHSAAGDQPAEKAAGASSTAGRHWGAARRLVGVHRLASKAWTAFPNHFLSPGDEKDAQFITAGKIFTVAYFISVVFAGEIEIAGERDEELKGGVGEPGLVAHA